MSSLATATVPSKVKYVSTHLRLTQSDIGDIVGTTARTVARWVSGAAEPQREAKARLFELVFVGERLAGLLKPEAANVWIFSPNALLDADTPAERIKEGDFKTVLSLIEALEDGVVV